MITWKWNIEVLIGKPEWVWHWKQFTDSDECQRSNVWGTSAYNIAPAWKHLGQHRCSHVTAVQTNLMDVKTVPRQNFYCNSVSRLHKPPWSLPSSQAFWMLLISRLNVQHSCVVQLCQWTPSGFQYCKRKPWPDAGAFLFLGVSDGTRRTASQPLHRTLFSQTAHDFGSHFPLRFFFLPSWKRLITSRTYSLWNVEVSLRKRDLSKSSTAFQ